MPNEMSKLQSNAIKFKTLNWLRTLFIKLINNHRNRTHFFLNFKLIENFSGFSFSVPQFADYD